MVVDILRSSFLIPTGPPNWKRRGSRQLLWVTLDQDVGQTRGENYDMLASVTNGVLRQPVPPLWPHRTGIFVIGRVRVPLCHWSRANGSWINAYQSAAQRIHCIGFGLVASFFGHLLATELPAAVFTFFPVWSISARPFSLAMEAGKTNDGSTAGVGDSVRSVLFQTFAWRLDQGWGSFASCLGQSARHWDHTKLQMSEQRKGDYRLKEIYTYIYLFLETTEFNLSWVLAIFHFTPEITTAIRQIWRCRGNRNSGLSEMGTANERKLSDSQ